MNAFEVTQAVTLTANYISQNCAPEQVAVLAVFFTQLGDTLATILTVNEICENHKTHFPKNDLPPVPELQGKAKHTKEKAKPITEK